MINLTKLRADFPGLIFEPKEELSAYTYMKVGGRAAALVDVRTQAELASLGAYCFTYEIPFLVLGGGSNVIVPDEGVDKLVIHNLTGGITITPKTETVTEVTADSGVVTAVLAARTAKAGLTGLEYFVGVPGTIGGAIKNNSHFTPADLIGDRILRVKVVTSAGETEDWGIDKLAFAYDYSIFHKLPAVILSATFLLKRADSAIIDEHIKKAALKRASTQPIGVPSSGCMFRNVVCRMSDLETLMEKLDVPDSAWRRLTDDAVMVAAGFLIDSAGLKGAQVGGAKVSEKHATYILNLGNATSKNIETLCEKIESTVAKKFGLRLEREVFFVR